MNKFALLFSFIFLLTFSSYAQYSFKILAAKGTNQVLRNGRWNVAKAGTKLLSNEKIKLSQNSYLGLIHSTGKTLELKESGEFTIIELEKRIVAGKSGFGSKYGKFVADGMFSSNENAKNNYNTTGSTSRDINSTIIVYSPLHMKAVKSIPFTIHWNNCGEGHTYVLTLKNLFNEEVFSKEFTSNSATLDFNDSSIPDVQAGNYFLQIVSKNDPNFTTYSSGTSVDNDYSIIILDDTKAAPIVKEIDDSEQYIDKNSAIDYMLLAAAYEKADLMTYALESYHKANELAPDVIDYKIQYEEYIKAKLDITDLKNR